MTSLICSSSNNSQPLNYLDEKAKLKFLEEKMRPVLSNHPLFNTNIYLIYKKWIENNTYPPLQLLTLKKYAENHHIYEMDNNPCQSLTDFAIFILNASFLEKQLTPKLNSPQQTFIGLFPHNPPSTKENLHFGILIKKSLSRNNPGKIEVGFCKGLNDNNPYTIGLALEETLSEDNIIRITGNKVFIPDFGSVFQGEVTKEIFDKNRILQSRLTGTWSYIGKATWRLTGDGSITIFNPDGTKKEYQTGKWKHLGNGRFELTTEDSETIYNQDGTIQRCSTGTWENTEAGRGKLINNNESLKTKKRKRASNF